MDEDILALLKASKTGSARFMITGVRLDTVDGRPQLMLDLKDKAGRAYSHELTRDMARQLTKLLGRHPLVDEFFRTGKGLQ